MKKCKKFLAVVLSLCIVFSFACPAISAKEDKAQSSISEYLNSQEYLLKRGVFLSKFLNKLVNDIILEVISDFIPNLSFVRDDETTDASENFFKGNETFIPTDSSKYEWNVGYGSESILPDDFGKLFKYARGSYAPWGYSRDCYTDDDGNKETMKVRTVMFDDNTGRGLTVFCVVDCIGISNSDVRKIRGAIADFAAEKNIVSLNVSAIHSHMAIDSQGVWNAPLTTVGNNLLSMFGLTETKFGVNEDYLNKIISSTKASVQQAYNDMKPGTLTYTNIELDGYFGTRTVSKECDTDMHRIVFNPANGSRGTLIASFGAHPEVTSYGAEFDTKLSSDFVYYMEKLVNAAGMNFMYIQGNVGTNSCGRSKSNDGLDLADNHESAMRFGYEMAYICLGAEMTAGERAALNDKLGDKLGVKQYAGQQGYTVWYEGLPTYKAQKVEAVLNIAHKQIKLEVDNSVSKILIKLGLASNDIAYNKNNGKYYTVTEIGYMELGTAVKVFLSPGELYSELYVGGYGLDNSVIKSLRESYGENVILFDLQNDAAGYVCPDENYSILDCRHNPDSDSREINMQTWCMVVSIGEHAASTLMDGYAQLVAESK